MGVVAVWWLAAELGQPGAVPVVGGTEAAPCQFPSVVALLTADGGQFCTGSIVAPRLVLTAGHCIDPGAAPLAARIALGEVVGEPVHEVAVESCEVHPDYEVLFDAQGFGSDLAADIGVCRLAEDAPVVPIVPVAAGCEPDTLAPGGEVVIVGFGSTAGGVDDDGVKWAEGSGRKRWKSQTIEAIDTDAGQLVITGEGGSSCFGDSGGPTLVRLADGTWRIVGVGSSLHPDDPLQCGLGAAIELAAPHLAWLEANSGVDLTPCFTDDAWTSGPDCGGFPLDPQAEGDWVGLCAGASSPAGASCAPAGGDESSGSDDGTQAESSTAADADGTSRGAGSSGSATSESSGAAPPADPDDAGAAGCGCTAGPGSPWGLLVLPWRWRATTRRSRSIVRPWSARDR